MACVLLWLLHNDGKSSTANKQKMWWKKGAISMHKFHGLEPTFGQILDQRESESERAQRERKKRTRSGHPTCFEAVNSIARTGPSGDAWPRPLTLRSSFVFLMDSILLNARSDCWTSGFPWRCGFQISRGPHLTFGSCPKNLIPSVLMLISTAARYRTTWTSKWIPLSSSSMRTLSCFRTCKVFLLLGKFPSMKKAGGGKETHSSKTHEVFSWTQSEEQWYSILPSPFTYQQNIWELRDALRAGILGKTWRVRFLCRQSPRTL